MTIQNVSPSVSEVTICNQALGWLGQNRIASLDDQSIRAQLCRENYPFLRDAVLEERMWTFATVRAISETANRDAWDEMYVHEKPQGWLKVFRVCRDNGNDDRTWRMEGDKVLSEESKIRLWGIQRVTATNLFSNLFVQALAARIAADLSIALTENRRLQVDMWSLYGDKLREAAARDGQQGANEQIKSSNWIEARARGYTLR